ncbi:uncharacterized protein RB166_018520 [Leptodactylus fuscus]
MLRCVTLLALLVITWTQQAASTKCSEKCKTKDHGELYSLMAKTEAAIKNILHSEEHKKILHDVCKRAKSKICELGLDAEAMSELRKKSEHILKQVQNGSLKESSIIEFLTNDPMKHMDALIEKLKTKKNKS